MLIFLVQAVVEIYYLRIVCTYYYLKFSIFLPPSVTLNFFNVYDLYISSSYKITHVYLNTLVLVLKLSTKRSLLLFCLYVTKYLISTNCECLIYFRKH